MGAVEKATRTQLKMSPSHVVVDGNAGWAPQPKGNQKKPVKVIAQADKRLSGN